MLIGLRRSGNFLLRKELTLNENAHALQALFPLRRRPLPVRGLLRKSRSPGLPLLLPALQEGRIRGGGLGVHLVLHPVRLPLLPLDLGPARGVEVSLVAHLLRASAPLSLRLLRELLRGRLLVRSGRPLPAPLPRWPLPAHHSTLCDVVSRESLLWSAPVCDPPVFPDLRIEEQGRIAEPAFGRTALVIAPVVLALALLTARGQAVESVGGGSRLDRCPPANGCNVIGLGLRTAPDHVAFALGLGEIGRDPRIATGLAATALDVTGRVLQTATNDVDSIRDPLLVGEVVVTIRGHAVPLAALVTARGHVCGLFPPLTARDRRRVGDELDVSDKRVWRRWLSPRLLSSLKRLASSSSSCWGCYCSSASVCCSGSRQVLFEPGGILFPWSGWRCCGRGCSCIWSGGSAVPFDSRWRSSRILCCDCDACWCGRLSCCSRCCARLVRLSAASGGLPLE